MPCQVFLCFVLFSLRFPLNVSSETESRSLDSHSRHFTDWAIPPVLILITFVSFEWKCVLGKPNARYFKGGRAHWEAFPEAARASWTGRLASKELRGLTEMNQSLGPFISLETETSLGWLGWMNWTEHTLCSASDFNEEEALLQGLGWAISSGCSRAALPTQANS